MKSEYDLSQFQDGDILSVWNKGGMDRGVVYRGSIISNELSQEGDIPRLKHRLISTDGIRLVQISADENDFPWLVLDRLISVAIKQGGNSITINLPLQLDQILED